MVRTSSRQPDSSGNASYDYDDGAMSSGDRSSSYIASQPSSEVAFDSETIQLTAELAETGFDAAFTFVQRYGVERVRRALDRAKSLPSGQIKNLPGYIRHLVTSPGPIARPFQRADRQDKYRKQGKFSHLIYR